jgi:putative membrane protein
MARSATLRCTSLWLLLFATPLLAAPTMDTQTFVEQAVEARVAETEAAQLALRHSQSDDVKGFAQQVIDHHPRENADLQTFARTRQIDLPADAELRKRTEPQLQQLRGDNFDARYVDLQARHYENSIALFSQAAEEGDEELQAFARAKLPVLKHHLQTVRTLTRAHPLS